MSEKNLSLREPFNWSRYQRTYNNAIDLVAQCVGYHRQRNLPIRAVVLKPTYYELFKAGTEVLMKKRLEPGTELNFDGVLIKCGTRKQFDSLVVEYYPTAKSQMN